MMNRIVGNVQFLLLVCCVSLLYSSQPENNQQQELMTRCRDRIQNFPSLNDPVGCLTLEELRLLSYIQQQELQKEALDAYLYHADAK